MNNLRYIKTLYSISKSLERKKSKLKIDLFNHVLLKIELLKYRSCNYSDDSILMLKIIKFLGDHYNLPINYFESKSRDRHFVKARQIGMTLIHFNTKLTEHKIAKKYGGRDHSTVNHAKKTVQNLRDTYKNYDNEFIYIAIKLRLKYYNSRK